MVSNDIGIDLGTANTLVYLRGKGVVLNEPSVVALNKKTHQIVAVGAPARDMFGRTPQHIKAIRPLNEGVIADFDISSEMIGYFIRKAQSLLNRKIIAPRVVVGIPSGTSSVERKSVTDAARNAGARSVYLVEEPVAAAIGINLPIHDPVGNMVVDIGGGTSDIAVLSLGGVVHSHNVRVGGDHFDKAIIDYIRNEFAILIGEQTAQRLKHELGYIVEPGEREEMVVRGRDLISGLPREVVITDADVRQALNIHIDMLVSEIIHVLENTPPEVSSDIHDAGVHLVGGGSQLFRLDEYIQDQIQIPVRRVSDPISCVARGTGVILENFERYRDILVQEKKPLRSKRSS